MWVSVQWKFPDSVVNVRLKYCQSSVILLAQVAWKFTEVRWVRSCPGKKSCKMQQNLATNLAASLARFCYQESCKGLTNIHVKDLAWNLARSCTTSCRKCCKILHDILQDLACKIHLYILRLNSWNTAGTYHVTLLYPFTVSLWSTLEQTQATSPSEIKDYYKVDY